MGKRLKILQVASHHFVRAGGSVQMVRLVEGLRQRGHEVVCAFNYKGDEDLPGCGTFTPLIQEGIPVFSFRMQRVQKYLHYLKFRKCIREHHFDVLHAHRFRALKFALRSGR